MKYILNFEITGCNNHCQHCYCYQLERKQELMDIEDVVSLANQFKHKMKNETEVYLLQEQTYHPDFIELISRLKVEGLALKDGKGLLVTNGFGLSKPEMLMDLGLYFSTVKFSLFGTEVLHDKFVKRTGRYNSIVDNSKALLSKNMKVVWQIMLTKGNAKDVKKLISVAKEIGVQYFVSADFFYSGGVLLNDDFIPTELDIVESDFEIYEVENEMFFPEYKAKDFIGKIDYDAIEHLTLDNLYIDSNFDVYPLGSINPQYKLGNLKTEMNNIIEMLNNPSLLPPKLKERYEIDFRSLLQNFESDSSQMHSPQTLFEKLVSRELE